MIDIHNMTVLITDDMPGMCKSIRGILKLLGYGKDFVFAENGAQAWRKLEHEDVDMAIIDWNMPVMKGVELLRRIRDDSRLWDLPVVMVTAEADTEIVAEVAETDIDAYLLKPLTVKSLGDRIVRVVDGYNNPPPSVRHLRAARECANKGNLVGAVTEAQQAVKEDPASTRPIRQLGYYYLQAGVLDQAEKWLKAAAEKNKLDVFAFNQLGELYIRQGDYESAAKYLERAMKISPRQLDRGLRLGTILLQIKLRDKARQIFDKTISVSKEPVQTRQNVADICIREGDKEYAVTLLQQAAKGLPDNANIHIQLGLLLDALKRHGEAVPHLTIASELDEGNLTVKLHLAQTYLSMKRPLWAEKYLHQVLKKDPENEQARALLQQCV